MNEPTYLDGVQKGRREGLKEISSLRQRLSEEEHRCGEWSKKWSDAGHEILEIHTKLSAAEKERDELKRMSPPKWCRASHKTVAFYNGDCPVCGRSV